MKRISFMECLEFFWLFQECQDIFDMYYNEDGFQISDDGYEEANCIAEEAWDRFEKVAKKLKMDKSG